VQKRNRNSENPARGIGQYREKIIRYLSRFVPSDHVEDFAQETLLNAHAYMHNGHKVDKPLAFLYTTARNVVRKSYRDGKTDAATGARTDIEALNLVSEAPSVERDVMSELEFEAFCVAIGRLPAKCRKAFVLRKVYQYSYSEIADHCGVSVNTVKNHVKKGFGLVQAYFDEREGLSPP
jgi:RNA polymerase sigma factor (sigma-70 family)